MVSFQCGNGDPLAEQANRPNGQAILGGLVEASKPSRHVDAATK
jgi:hypothetical protein